MSTAPITDRPEWPKSEPGAVGLMRYAAAEGMWLLGRSRGLSSIKPYDTDTARMHMTAIVMMQHWHDVHVALHALRDLDQAKADEVANFVWVAAEAGDSYGEWLWSWSTKAGDDPDAIYEAGRISALPETVEVQSGHDPDDNGSEVQP